MAERDHLLTATIHVANIVMTIDTNIVVSNGPGIEITQQYDLVILLDRSEGNIQDVLKAFFHIIKRVKCWCMNTHKGSNAIFSMRNLECHYVLIFCDGGFLGVPQIIVLAVNSMQRFLWVGYSRNV